MFEVVRVGRGVVLRRPRMRGASPGARRGSPLPMVHQRQEGLRRHPGIGSDQSRCLIPSPRHQPLSPPPHRSPGGDLGYVSDDRRAAVVSVVIIHWDRRGDGAAHHEGGGSAEKGGGATDLCRQGFRFMDVDPQESVGKELKYARVHIDPVVRPCGWDGGGGMGEMTGVTGGG